MQKRSSRNQSWRWIWMISFEAEDCKKRSRNSENLLFDTFWPLCCSWIFTARFGLEKHHKLDKLQLQKTTKQKHWSHTTVFLFLSFLFCFLPNCINCRGNQFQKQAKSKKWVFFLINESIEKRSLRKAKLKYQEKR